MLSASLILYSYHIAMPVFCHTEVRGIYTRGCLMRKTTPTLKGDVMHSSHFFVIAHAQYFYSVIPRYELSTHYIIFYLLLLVLHLCPSEASRRAF